MLGPRGLLLVEIRYCGEVCGPRVGCLGRPSLRVFRLFRRIGAPSFCFRIQIVSRGFQALNKHYLGTDGGKKENIETAHQIRPPVFTV